MHAPFNSLNSCAPRRTRSCEPLCSGPFHSAFSRTWLHAPTGDWIHTPTPHPCLLIFSVTNVLGYSWDYSCHITVVVKYNIKLDESKNHEAREWRLDWTDKILNWLCRVLPGLVVLCIYPSLFCHRSWEKFDASSPWVTATCHHRIYNIGCYFGCLKDLLIYWSRGRKAPIYTDLTPIYSHICHHINICLHIRLLWYEPLSWGITSYTNRISNGPEAHDAGTHAT
jgi:hypothetical protein